MFGDANIADQVKGKPILLLCNKADMDQAQVRHSSSSDCDDFDQNVSIFCNLSKIEVQPECPKDEVEVVSRLEIESLVNSAQCPTR